jgi:hypothetical protein
VALHAHVAVDDGEARVQAAAPFDLYVATRLYAKRQTYDDVLRSGLSLIGGVPTVTRKLKQLEAVGVHHVLAIHNFGMMPQYQVMSSMDRFAAIAHAMNGSSRRGLQEVIGWVAVGFAMDMLSVYRTSTILFLDDLENCRPCLIRAFSWYHSSFGVVGLSEFATVSVRMQIQARCYPCFQNS